MIYLLEDDDSIRKLVIYGLESQGYEAQGFELPSLFWKAMGKQLPELILLDIMLPEEDGLTILQKLRSASATKKIPVIMLTAKNTEYDRVIGLDNGADDFVSKPFGMMELVARVRAVLRRTEPASSSTEYQVGPLYVSPERHIVKVNGQDVTLTYKEFEILCLLLENEGVVLTRRTARWTFISAHCAPSWARPAAALRRSGAWAISWKEANEKENISELSAGRGAGAGALLRTVSGSAVSAL